MDFLTFLVMIAVVATVVVLFAGLTSMLKGGEDDRQHSVQLMFTGVGFQTIARILLIVAALYAGNVA